MGLAVFLVHTFKVFDNKIIRMVYVILTGWLLTLYLFVIISKLNKWLSNKMFQGITLSRECLITGAILFVSGTVLQIIATYLS